MFHKPIAFVKKNMVMCIALLAAIITGIFIPVDAEYLGYFDFKTLVCLFSVLALFSLFNFGFLILLTALMLFL